MTSSNAIERAIEVDDVLMELTEALKYQRKREKLTVSDPELESKIARRLAICCIKQTHAGMHDRGSQTYYPHRQLSECRSELINRCQSLRYTEIKQLMQMAVGTNVEMCGPHSQYLEMDL